MCISFSELFTKTSTPCKYKALIVFATEALFPGIGLEENITVSVGLNFICLWVPLAILDKAANGSPCEPVHNKQISSGGKVLATSGETKILSSFMYPPSIDISMLFSILLPNNAIFLLFFLQVSTMCFNLYMLDAKVATIILPFFFSNISCNSSSTFDSLIENPGDNALVDSLIKSLTPDLPVSDIL